MSRSRKSLSIPANLRRRYLAGEFTQAELARHPGVSVYWLRRALVRLGVPTLSPAGRRWGLRAVPLELVESYQRGELSMVDIAKRLGVSRPTVALRLRARRACPRPRRGRQSPAAAPCGPRGRGLCRLRAEGWAVSRHRARQILKPAFVADRFCFSPGPQLADTSPAPLRLSLEYGPGDYASPGPFCFSHGLARPAATPRP